MLTLESLAAYGADIQTGMKRCVNKESLYLRLVKTVPGNDSFEKLRNAVASKDLETAFQAAHGLKGVTANLSLTPLCEPLTEITEHLRKHEDTDYSLLLDEIKQRRTELEEICKND